MVMGKSNWCLNVRIWVWITSTHVDSVVWPDWCQEFLYKSQRQGHPWDLLGSQLSKRERQFSVRCCFKGISWRKIESIVTSSSLLSCAWAHSLHLHMLTANSIITLLLLFILVIAYLPVLTTQTWIIILLSCKKIEKDQNLFEN